ncbi:histidine kinase dimerization/phospho-acceptor domain-containing protein [Xylophilus sp.]|uniref:histidine kinase dimerization/phospho-acceptor domain-containing protein n=1 Tax=Xylophilus sp. TaxID=2653893 RepID=UPI0013BAB3C1|nr:histidine kinase dimerization/phospho-acceptor domain-containing protein [Xylophilus sp.]KAF1048227.1 MAG: Sensor protein QseC [Xylophilus sp.]
MAENEGVYGSVGQKETAEGAKAGEYQNPTRRPPSLTNRLLLWVLGALLAVWGSFVALGYQTGVHEADELTDGHLASVAALLLNLDATGFRAPAETTPRVDMPLLRAHDYQQSFSVFLWDAQGRLVGRRGDAPAPAFAPDAGFADQRLGPGGERWRSFAQWSTARDRRIMVLVEREERDSLAEDIAGQMIEPGLWLLPVVALALGLAIWRGLRPLYVLSDDVAALDVARAGRLPARYPLHEFSSVVGSINALLDRQQAALARERRLASEVAHELRTPLASIVLQARALGGPLAEAERGAALARIGADALRAGHVLDQLLALARASRAQMHDAAAAVDLAAIARTAAADYAQAAWRHGSAIAVAGPHALPWHGHAVLLDIALRNLIENALRHTPQGTVIEIACGSEGGGTAWIEVRDDGRRLGPDGRAAVPPPAPVDSLHLGHEIVARVAQAHGGRFAAAPAGAPWTTAWRIELARPPAGA